MNTIHLDPKQVPPQLRGSYTGKQFKARVTDSVTIPADAGLWGGGTRDKYYAVRIADGALVPFPGQDMSPWDDRTDRKVTLQPGFAVVCHTIFQGKDLGLTYYLHPVDAAPMLPAPVQLDPIEALVLEYTCARKSSYNGQDRFQMAVSDARYRSHPGVTLLDRPQWESAKARLIERGYLNKAGAVTTAGRNARPGR